MAEVLVEFDTTIAAADGSRWVPRVCGAIADDGLWEGWIEFTPANGSGEPIRTRRETEQPKRADLLYWAQGLTQAYLELALVRALDPPRWRRRAVLAARPHFDAPAPRTPVTPSPSLPRPVLNPFEVYRQGENVLLQELSALSELRLRDIAVGYGLAVASGADGMNRAELVGVIVAGVRRPANLIERPRDATPP